MRVGGKVTPETFAIPSSKDAVQVNVIEIIPNKVGNYRRIETLPCTGGAIQAAPEQDILKAAVFERHQATGKTGFGFVKGFGIRNGAIMRPFSATSSPSIITAATETSVRLSSRTRSAHLPGVTEPSS